MKNRFYLVTIFAIGATSLIYEIYSTRVLFLFILQTNWAITIAITAFLTGLAFSSLLFSKIHRSEKNNLTLLFYMQITVALYGFLVLSHYELIPVLTSLINNIFRNGTVSEFFKISLMWIYLFVPAFFIGGSFPLINGLYLKSKASGVSSSGTVYFWDTIGSVFGALVAGFILLPFLGFYLTCAVAALLNLIIGFFLAQNTRMRLIPIALFTVVLGISFYPYILPGLKNQKNPLDSRFGKVIFQQNSPYGIVTVGTHADPENGRIIKGLFINYRDMCYTSSKSELKLASDPISKLKNKSQILVIGLGCGLTANQAASDPKVAHVDIVEINPIVVKADREEFAKENNNLLENKKITLLTEDGAQYLRTTNKTYDAIIIDIEEPTIIDSSPLYTKEYFYFAKLRLKTNGIFALWAQNGTPDYAKVLYNTLGSEFNYVSPRVLDGFFIFYSSDYNYIFNLLDLKEKQAVKNILNSPVQEINTLNKPIIDNYFDLKKFFDLPKNYHEPYSKN